MVEIKNVKVYDLKESVIACRNAMRTVLPQYTEEEFQQSLVRAVKQANAPSGSGEETFLSGIRVSFDLVYPNYLSPELQRYHWVDIVTSSSKMHKLMSMNFDKCCNKYVTAETIQQMKDLVSNYNSAPTYERFMLVVSNCPQGIELFMRVSTNYLQLKTIYRQRRHHRLKEDWGAFCDFIEGLPYARKFITGDSEPENKCHTCSHHNGYNCVKDDLEPCDYVCRN